MNKGIFIFLIFVSVTAHAQTHQDYRMHLAVELRALGEKLQEIQDQEGIQKAHGVFDTLSSQQRLFFQKQIKESLGSLTEEKAALIVSDRSLTAKQKLERLQVGSFLEGYQKDVKDLKKQAESEGYKKVFYDLAHTFQDRSYFEYQNGHTGFILASSALFFTMVYFVAIIPPPLSYAMASVPACLFIWMVWDTATSPEEKTSDYILPPDDFNLDRYKLIPEIPSRNSR